MNQATTSFAKFALSVSFLAMLASCGGGGGGGGASSSTTSLSGSISQGAPIVGAKITLIDAKGTVVDGGTSASDGSYAVTDISSLTAPILISAQATVGGKPVTYRSVLVQKGTNNTANVTPITDAVLAQATGKSTALMEVAASSTLTTLDVSKLNKTTNKMVTAVSNVLDQITAGTSASFNPFTSTFKANGEDAADKVNDLLRFTSTISSTGVTTEIIDKSNSVGSVTISDSSNTTALPSLPQDLMKVKPQYLANFLTAITDAVSTPAKLDGTALENLFDSQFLDNGMIKSDIVSMFRTEGRATVLGAKFSNPKLEYCDTNNVCLLYITLKNTNSEVRLDLIVKYYPTQTKFVGYGNQFKFQAQFGSSLKKEYDQSNNFTLRSQIQFGINSEPTLWNKYQSAKVTLQSGSSAPDLTYNFVLKPNYCSTSIGNYYDGMPFDNGTNDCDTWKFFDSSNQMILKTINEKIKLGGYTAKFQVWKNTNRSDTPDEAILAITNPILTPDTLGADGYPRITVVQGTGGGLPYLSIDNADDFVVSGSLCISSVTFCDVKSTTPPAHTTVSMPNNTKLPSKYSAKSSDGWQAGSQAKSFFIHVIDKAGRDMMVQKN
jgi:hypothetical protein